MSEHCLTVYDEFVLKAEAKFIVAVAHSAGGCCITDIVRERIDTVQTKLCGIAFTDSVHSVGSRDPAHVKHIIQKRARNWVTSKAPLDTPCSKGEYDCLRVSAGHDTHEYTSGYAIESVFDYLMKRILIFPTEDYKDKNYDTKDHYMK